MKRFPVLMSDDTSVIKMADKATKIRSKQFSYRETEVLRDLVKTHYAIITAKHSSGSAPVTKRSQDTVWKEIVMKVNSVGNCSRTVAQVKERWRNMVKKAKTEFTAERISSQKTGGGPPIPEITQVSQDIIGLLGKTPSFSGIPGASASETAIGLEDSDLSPIDGSLLALLNEEEGNADEPDLTMVDNPNEVAVESSDNTQTARSSIITSTPCPADKSRKPKSLKEVQLEYYQQAMALNATQMKCFATQTKCFEKWADLADTLNKKFSI